MHAAQSGCPKQWGLFCTTKTPARGEQYPPEMAPTDGQEIATGLTLPCPARAEHETLYGTQGRQQLTTYATEPPSQQLSVR